MVNKLTIWALAPFLSRPSERLHLAEISKTLKVPHPTARLWLAQLERKGVLRKHHKGRLTLHSLTIEHPQLLDYLVIAEKQRLLRACEDSALFGELVGFLHTFPENALVFGSAAENFRTANDVDLLLTGKGNPKPVYAFSRRLGKEAHIIQARNLGSVSQALKAEIVKKHLLVNGSEAFVRWMVWQR